MKPRGYLVLMEYPLYDRLGEKVVGTGQITRGFYDERGAAENVARFENDHVPSGDGTTYKAYAVVPLEEDGNE
jgi:hypothetical protein